MKADSAGRNLMFANLPVNWFRYCSLHVQLPRALQIIYDGSSNPEERKVVENLRRGLHEGKRFSQLLKKEKKLFPVIYSSMAEVGEESGELSNVLEEVYKFLKDGRDLRVS